MNLCTIWRIKALQTLVNFDSTGNPLPRSNKIRRISPLFDRCDSGEAMRIRVFGDVLQILLPLMILVLPLLNVVVRLLLSQTLQNLVIFLLNLCNLTLFCLKVQWLGRARSWRSGWIGPCTAHSRVLSWTSTLADGWFVISITQISIRHYDRSASVYIEQFVKSVGYKIAYILAV
jgi:hypothetical protein